jgi:hypothetical protein
MPITASDFQIWQTGGQQITVGPAGPSAVSKDANNKATLGSDSLILVQGVGTGASATTHAQVVSGDDPQLTNARTPTGHNSTHLSGGSDAISLVTTSAAGLCVPPDGSTILITGGKLVSVGGGSAGVSTDANNKATLGSDSKILVQGTALGIAATTHAQTVSGDDPQLTNARTPIAHEASHVTGSDQIPFASASTKGLLNQTSGNTTDFIDGTNNSQALAPVIWSVRLRSFNALGNPTFEVDQRNVNQSLANIASGIFAQDRWCNQKAGTATLAYSAGAYPAPFGSGVLVPGTNFCISRGTLQLTLTAQQATLGAGDYAAFQQLIEGPRFRELSQDVHSFSILAYTTVAGGLKFGAILRDPGNTRTLAKLCTLTAANTWQLIQLPNLPAWPTAGNFSVAPGVQGYSLFISLACGATYMAPANDTWQNGSFIGAIGQDNFGSKPVNSILYLAFVQHEPGPLCTTPIDCPFDQNLDDCLRYLQKSYGYSIAKGSSTFNGAVGNFLAPNTGSAAGGVRFPKAMAKSPSLSLYNPNNGSANQAFDLNSSTNIAISVTGSEFLSEGGFLQITGGTYTLGHNYAIHYIVDTGW